MSWTIDIEDGAETVTIEEHATFERSWRKVQAGNGRIEAIVKQATIEGKIIGTPAAVAAGIRALKALVDEKATLSRVVFSLDGSEDEVWESSTGFQGPFVTDLEEVKSPGGGGAHRVYRMTITFTGKGDSGEETDNLMEFFASVSTTRDHDKVIRKVWTAGGKGTSAAAALSRARSYKPSGQDVREVEQLDPSNQSGSVTYTWEALQEVFCSVEYFGGRIDYVADPQAGAGADPILHLKQRGELEVRVKGIVRGFSPALTPPAPHFSESDTLRRAYGRERTGKLEIENAERGIYRLPFEEVWVSAGPTPEPSHADNHHLITLGGSKVPGDGPIVGA